MKFEPPTPVVGIPCYRHRCDALLGGLGSAMTDTYLRALEGAGCAAMLIPVPAAEPVLEALYRVADGLLLAGGPDVAPAAYGEEPHPALRAVSAERDRVEMTLLRWALTDRKPVLCICRGIQVLNVVSGGTLWQDLAAQLPGAERHDLHPDHPPDHHAHTVRVEAGSRLHRILGSESIWVNSLHHQAVHRLGRGLSITARSPDGVVEAVEGDGPGWLVGVQWHPEWLVEKDPGARNLFDAFAKACSERREGGATPAEGNG